MGLDTSLLNTQQYKVHIKGKVEQSRKRSSTPLHLSVEAIEKGTFWLSLTSDYGLVLMGSVSVIVWLTVVADWGCPPCYSGVSETFMKDSPIFLASKKFVFLYLIFINSLSLLFYLKRSWKCGMVFLAIGIFFHNVVWVPLATLFTCQMSFTALPVVSIFMTFKAPQDVCFNLSKQYPIFAT